MPNIGPLEWVIILVIALIVLGPGKLPEVGAAFGKTLREFRKAATDIQDSTDITKAPPAAPAPNTLAAPSTPNAYASAAPEAPASVAPLGTPTDPVDEQH